MSPESKADAAFVIYPGSEQYLIAPDVTCIHLMDMMQVVRKRSEMERQG